MKRPASWMLEVRAKMKVRARYWLVLEIFKCLRASYNGVHGESFSSFGHLVAVDQNCSALDPSLGLKPWQQPDD